ncbi:extracellular solute-binding protein [Haloarchaeobius baliensis]|uniref:extracellular solute-binding protein n=1 Tax=Haloarchaeobius baliensis TaxID=1670458 RepID=UPI003F883D6B
MSQHRRKLLAKMAATAALGSVAGCLGVQESSESNTTEPDQSTETATSDGENDDGSNEQEGLPMLEPENSGGSATLWHARREAERRSLQDQVSRFNDEYDQSVSADEVAELGTRTETAIPAGQGPHSFDHAHDWAGKYYQNGWVVDESDSVRLDLSEYFTDVAAQAAQFDGATVGLPYAAETVGLVYNTELVDEPPETVSEMQAIMDEHHAPSEGTYGLSYPVDPYFVSAWVHAFGGFYYDDGNDELGLENSETVEGLQYYMDNFAPYMPDSPDYGAQADVFKQGRAPFAINGPWFLGSAADAGIDTGVAPLPTADGSEPSPYTGVKLLFFSKKMGNGSDANATASREFAEWYTTNTDVLRTLAEEHSYIPVHRELADSDDLPDTVGGYAAAVQQGYAMPTNPKMQGVWGPVGDAITRVYNGQAEPEGALATAADEVRDNWNS